MTFSGTVKISRHGVVGSSLCAIDGQHRLYALTRIVGQLALLHPTPPAAATANPATTETTEVSRCAGGPQGPKGVFPQVRGSVTGLPNRRLPRSVSPTSPAKPTAFARGTASAGVLFKVPLAGVFPQLHEAFSRSNHVSGRVHSTTTPWLPAVTDRIPRATSSNALTCDNAGTQAGKSSRRVVNLGMRGAGDLMGEMLWSAPAGRGGSPQRAAP